MIVWYVYHLASERVPKMAVMFLCITFLPRYSVSSCSEWTLPPSHLCHHNLALHPASLPYGWTEGTQWPNTRQPGGKQASPRLLAAVPTDISPFSSFIIHVAPCPSKGQFPFSLAAVASGLAQIIRWSLICWVVLLGYFPRQGWSAAAVSSILYTTWRLCDLNTNWNMDVLTGCVVFSLNTGDKDDHLGMTAGRT
jgi:hypothetical protein